MTTGNIFYGSNDVVVTAQRFVAPDRVEPAVRAFADEYRTFAGLVTNQQKEFHE